MKLGMPVGLDPGHIVLDGDPPRLPQTGTDPIFGPYVLWPMAGWINMSLDMKVGLGLGDFVLNGDPAPPP